MTELATFAVAAVIAVGIFVLLERRAQGPPSNEARALLLVVLLVATMIAVVATVI